MIAFELQVCLPPSFYHHMHRRRVHVAYLWWHYSVVGWSFLSICLFFHIGHLLYL